MVVYVARYKCRSRTCARVRVYFVREAFPERFYIERFSEEKKANQCVSGNEVPARGIEYENLP